MFLSTLCILKYSIQYLSSVIKYLILIDFYWNKHLLFIDYSFLGGSRSRGRSASLVAEHKMQPRHPLMGKWIVDRQLTRLHQNEKLYDMLIFAVKILSVLCLLIFFYLCYLCFARNVCIKSPAAITHILLLLNSFRNKICMLCLKIRSFITRCKKMQCS
jgi:hypothetical protein